MYVALSVCSVYCSTVQGSTVYIHTCTHQASGKFVFGMYAEMTGTEAFPGFG